MTTTQVCERLENDHEYLNYDKCVEYGAFTACNWKHFNSFMHKALM